MIRPLSDFSLMAEGTVAKTKGQSFFQNQALGALFSYKRKNRA
jgi:hypothetical protein